MKKTFFYLMILIILTKLVTVNAIGNEEEEETRSLMNSLYYLSDFLLLGLMAITLLFNGLTKHIAYLLLFIALLVFIVFLSSIYNETELIDSVKSSFKLFLPLLFFTTLFSIKNHLDFRFTKVVPVLVISLSFYALAFFPPSTNRSELYWAVYFSGLHTHCYVLLAGLLIIVANYKNSNYPWWAKGYMLFASIGIIWGYNVRTTIVGLIILMLPAFNKKVKRYFGNYTHFYIVVSLVYLILLCALLFIDFGEVNEFSSGRLSMYEFKLSMILERGAIENLVGSGLGSDLVVTDIWWWGEKGSHNDYLTIGVEYGFLFLAILLLMFRQIYKNLRAPKARLIFWIYLACSMFSNGFFFRPLPAMIALLAIVIAEGTRLKNESEPSKDTVNSFATSKFRFAN